MTNAQQIKTVNLYGEENGIAIYLSPEGDIATQHEPGVIKVVGHALYVCPAQEAEEKIRAEYIRQYPQSTQAQAQREMDLYYGK